MFHFFSDFSLSCHCHFGFFLLFSYVCAFYFFFFYICLFLYLLFYYAKGKKICCFIKIFCLSFVFFLSFFYLFYTPAIFTSYYVFLPLSCFVPFHSSVQVFIESTKRRKLAHVNNTTLYLVVMKHYFS